jgi:hypothetical protein
MNHAANYRTTAGRRNRRALAIVSIVTADRGNYLHRQKVESTFAGVKRECAVLFEAGTGDLTLWVMPLLTVNPLMLRP